MKELKKIPLDKGFFEAGGVKFFIKNTLTVERFKQFERLQNHFGFGKSFSDIYADLKFAMELANKGKMVESWNVIVNLRDGIKNNIDEKEHPALLLCTLFAVTENEDLTKWTEEAATEKIALWNKEGYDVNDFFRLAANLVTNFIPILDEISQSILEGEKRVKSLLSESE